MTLHHSKYYSLSYSVRIRSLIWANGEHGLYDYDTRDIFETTIRVRKNSILCFKGDHMEVSLISDPNADKEDKVMHIEEYGGTNRNKK